MCGTVCCIGNFNAIKKIVEEYGSAVNLNNYNCMFISFVFDIGLSTLASKALSLHEPTSLTHPRLHMYGWTGPWQQHSGATSTLTSM